MPDDAPRAPQPPMFGEPAPWFAAATDTTARFNFDTVGGRWVLLLFFGTLSPEPTRLALERVLGARGLFDDARACFFGVSVDPTDRAQGRIEPQLPGVRYFHDHDGAVSRLYGVLDAAGRYRPMVFLLDPTLRVAACGGIEQTGQVLEALAGHLAREAPQEPDFAPVLVAPRVFEPAFCAELIAHYEATGGAPSGFMRQVGEKTVGVQDPSFKRRLDVDVAETPLAARARARLTARLIPMIERAYGWKPTRLERYLVACYDSAEQGFFRAHRDNTTLGTAHRKLAVTLNLNSDDYEGGELSFPEFGPRTYKPPTGGAVVFACGLLHEARPVTRGRRYAFLPFLYDEAAARVREANQGALQAEAPSPPLPLAPEVV